MSDLVRSVGQGQSAVENKNIANPKFAALVKKKLLVAGGAGVSPAYIQMQVIKALVIP
jgi:hypothetical protein